MTSSYEFLQYLQNKKKKLNDQNQKLDLQEMQHRIQVPAVKMEKQRIKITQNEFLQLVKLAKNKLIHQPSLLKLDGPIYIVTGTYGSHKQLSLILQKCGNPKFVNYLFLGDYTGVYERGIECLTALLTYKIKHPYNFFMLRGAYESIQKTNSSSLMRQILEYFGSSKVWIQVCELFCCLPFAATISNQVFCVHGGISPYLFSLEQINNIHRPINTTSKGLPHQLVYAEPSYGQGSQSEKHSLLFSQNETQSFLKRTNMKLICRNQSVVEYGFEFIFNKSIINLCSVSNFRNQYMNSSAVLMIDDSLNIIVKQINSSSSPTNDQNEEGLTFKEIVQRRQEKKLQQQENQKPIDVESL